MKFEIKLTILLTATFALIIFTYFQLPDHQKFNGLLRKENIPIIKPGTKTSYMYVLKGVLKSEPIKKGFLISEIGYFLYLDTVFKDEGREDAKSTNAIKIQIMIPENVGIVLSDFLDKHIEVKGVSAISESGDLIFVPDVVNL